jgi:hypothetical protein
MSLAPRLLSFNPELQRCLWLELTPTRLILMPAMAAVIFGGLHLANADLAPKALTGLWLLLVLWGARLAADAFAEEVAEKTWDIQRLSSTPPLSIALGKLFGGTAYAWYGALFCLLVLAIEPGAINGGAVLGVLEAGLVAQAAALFAALVLHRLGRGVRRGRVSLAQVAGILAGWPGQGSALLLFQHAPLHGSSLDWYGASFALGDFTAALQLGFGLWFVVGTVRLIRREQGFRDGPLAWSLFTLYAVLVAAGFVFPAVDAMLVAAAAAAALVSYLGLLATPLTAVDVKRLALAWQGRAWHALWRHLPAWVPSAVLAVVLDLALLASAPAWVQTLGHWLVLGTPVRAGWLALFLRDIALVCWLRLFFPRRGALGLVILFALLYAFIPWVGFATGGWQRLLIPDVSTTPADLFGPWLEAVLAMGLLAVQVRGTLRARG